MKPGLQRTCVILCVDLVTQTTNNNVLNQVQCKHSVENIINKKKVVVISCQVPGYTKHLQFLTQNGASKNSWFKAKGQLKGGD